MVMSVAMHTPMVTEVKLPSPDQCQCQANIAFHQDSHSNDASHWLPRCFTWLQVGGIRAAGQLSSTTSLRLLAEGLIYGRTDMTRQLRVSITYSFLSKAPATTMPLSGRMPSPAMGPRTTNAN